MVLSANLHLEPQLIGDHGDELRIGGFSFIIMYGIAENGIQNVDIAPVHATSMAWRIARSPPGMSGIEFFCDSRIKELGHRVDHLRVPQWTS
jgi:hypothetical protein